MAKTRTIVRYRAKKAKHRSKAGMTLPVAVLAGFAPLAGAAIAGYQYNGFQGVMKRVALGTTGFNTEDGKWYPMEAVKVLGPIVGGVVVHKLASRLGINRALASAGVPFLRV